MVFCVIDRIASEMPANTQQNVFEVTLSFYTSLFGLPSATELESQSVSKVRLNLFSKTLTG